MKLAPLVTKISHNKWLHKFQQKKSGLVLKKLRDFTAFQKTTKVLSMEFMLTIFYENYAKIDLFLLFKITAS